MGCSGSKGTETQSTAASPPCKQTEDTKGGENVYLSVEEAVEYIANEFGVSETRAAKIVEKVDKNEDGKVANDELANMWAKLKDKFPTSIKEEFQELDKNKTGSVTLEEAEAVFAKKFSGLPEKGIKAMVKRYDTDDNGKMDYTEFLYFYCNMLVKREDLEVKFEALDKDQSGDLPANDVSALIQEECNLDDYMARSLVEDFDVNKDDKINRKEFNELLAKLLG